MQTAVMVGIVLALGLAVPRAEAATKAPSSPAPACSAISFRPLPPGMPDGERQAGVHKSRHGRLELHGEVKQGNPVDYYVTSAGKRVAAAPPSLPEAAVTCAASKKMPKPENPSASCTGQRFKVVVAHAADQRLALLYAQDGSSWRFCSAGTF